MKRQVALLTLLLCCSLSFGTIVLDGTTSACWNFGDDNINPMPDQGYNPYGDPDLMVYPVHPWHQEIGGHVGVWALSGAIRLDIPNNPVANEYKEITMRMVWAGEIPSPAAIPTIIVTATAVDGSAIPMDDIMLVSRDDVQLDRTGDSTIGDFWYESTFVYKIMPNPRTESIDIAGSILVDSLCVDTICIPEPMTLVMLGAGALMSLKRRRN